MIAIAIHTAGALGKMFPEVAENADALFRRKRMIAAAVPAVIAAYFVYVFFALDVPGLAQHAKLENAVTLAADSWSYKTHVTRTHSSGALSYAIEGARKGRYPEGVRPDWVRGGDTQTTITLDAGHEVRFLPDNRVEIDVPGFGTIEAQLIDGRVETNLGDSPPEWVNASPRRVAITRSKTEVFRYFGGWE